MNNIDCPPADGDGKPFLKNCMAGIQKHLARAAMTEKLFDNYYDSIYKCNEPTILGVCPESFCGVLDDFVLLNVGYILRAAGPFGSDHRFRNNINSDGVIDNFVKALPQFVNDINNAYDCAGIRRPLIQASIFESVDGVVRSWPPNGLRLVETVQIDTDVINEFWDEMSASQQNYYSATPTPKYTFANLAWQQNNGNWSPDVTKLEGRMWLFQKAKLYVDAGFTSLHMGQVHIWARIGFDKGKQNLGGDMIELTRLINRIRDYAKPLNLIKFPDNGNNPGIIITFETGDNEYYNNNNFNEGLIFDHNQYDAKPNEVISPTTANYDPNHVNSFTDNGNFSTTAPNCLGMKNAVIDHYASYKGSFPSSSSATSPIGCVYPGRTPGSVYLDQGGGIQWVVENGDTTDFGSATPSNSGNDWGYDDISWFRQDLDSDLCKGQWLSHEVAWAKGIENGISTFLQIPILVRGSDIREKILNSNASSTSGLNPNDFEPGKTWYMRDHPAVFTAVQNVWTVNPVTPSDIGTSFISSSSNGNLWKFTANNTDNTSIYSIHIKKPDGGWVPFNYGLEKTVTLTQSGVYTIYLRQDNVGLEQSISCCGVEQVSVSIYNFIWNGFKVSSDANEEILSRNYMIKGKKSTELEIQEVENSSPYGENLVVESAENINTSFEINYSRSEFKPSSFDVFPNPMTDKFTITTSLENSGNLKLSLFNTLGKKIKELVNEAISYKGNYIYEGNLSDLPAGTYLVLLEFDGKIEMQKLFKQ